MGKKTVPKAGANKKKTPPKGATPVAPTAPSPTLAARIAAHPWVALAVVVATVVGTAVALWAFVIDHQPPPRPNLAVCESINSSRLQMTPTGAGEDSRAWAVDLRTEAAVHLAQAEPGSDLAVALEAEIQAYDVVVASTSDDELTGDEIYRAFIETMDASIGVSEACEALGIEMMGHKPYESADGSISDDDAWRYCEAAGDLLLEAAVAETDDDHLWDLTLVMLNRADEGLPPEVYGATIHLETMLVMAVMGEGYPEAEGAAGVIKAYCQGHGMSDWPRHP